MKRLTHFAFAVILLAGCDHATSPTGVAPELSRPSFDVAGAQTITLVSGNGPIGGRDAANRFTLDNGTTFIDAYIVNGPGSLIPGTRYISYSPTNIGLPRAAVRFRTTFVLPPNYTNASLSVDVHADNVATVFLNGNQFGQQPHAEIVANFVDPAERFTTANPAQFRTGENVLEIDLFNFNNPTSLDYKAVVAFEVDVIPPVITVPPDITTSATSPAGAPVNYTATATDDNGDATLVCAPASDSTFPIGITTVACAASDAAGNTSNATFQVTVKGAHAQIDDLATLVRSLGLHDGIENSLLVKLEAALAALDAEDQATACQKLQDFIDHTLAQSGKKIAETDAVLLIGEATRIRAVVGC